MAAQGKDRTKWVTCVECGLQVRAESYEKFHLRKCKARNDAVEVGAWAESLPIPSGHSNSHSKGPGLQTGKIIALSEFTQTYRRCRAQAAIGCSPKAS